MKLVTIICPRRHEVHDPCCGTGCKFYVSLKDSKYCSSLEITYKYSEGTGEWEAQQNGFSDEDEVHAVVMDRTLADANKSTR